MEKVTNLFKKLPKFIHKKKIRDSMAFVLMYGVLLVALFLLFIFGWAFNGFASGRFDLRAVTDFYGVATGAGALAMLTFVVVFNIDKNGDGRPDAAESKITGGNQE